VTEGAYLKTVRIVPLCLRALFALLALAVPAAAQQASGRETMTMDGVVGPYRVGMNLTVRDHRIFEAGHYYYAHHPVDIPLTGEVSGEDVTLNEPGDGVFKLHLVTNAATKQRPLTFYISTGLEGTWTKGGRTLPVKITFDSAYPGGAPTRWYADVTDENDITFEARVQKFVDGIIDGRPEEVAASGSWPIQVTVGSKKPFLVRNARELRARWSEIDTPQLITQAKLAVPHEMFVHESAAMLSNGVFWFGPGRAAYLRTP
jgi:hypothetical protein